MTHTQNTRKITVYCGSADGADPAYARAADELGRALGKAGFMLVYGGGSLGLMGHVADAMHETGGKVHGVITHKLVSMEVARHTCDELEVVETMRQRKQRMEELADAFIALPGGVGTYEEFFEMLAARKLGYHDKPLLILNIAGYFESLINMLQMGVKQGFIGPEILEIYRVFEEPEQAVAYLVSELNHRR